MSTQRSIGTIGSSVAGDDELEQSLRLLVGVRKGGIPHRPDLGSLLFELLDEPVNVVQAKAPLYVAQAVAVDERFQVDSTEVTSVLPGQLELTVTWHPVRSTASRTTRVTVT